MKLMIFPAIFATFVVCGASQSQAQSVREMIQGNAVPDCVEQRQRNDFCAKPFPCAIPVRHSNKNDYCGKQQPGTCPVSRFECDDYFAKPIPRVCSQDCLCGSNTCRRCQRLAKDQNRNDGPQKRVISSNRSPFAAPFSIEPRHPSTSGISFENQSTRSLSR